MVLVCIVKLCTDSRSKTKEKGDKMHRFPQDISLCYDWLTNCNRLDLREKTFSNYRVCSKHFISEMYANPEQTILLPTAVPTQFESTVVSIEPTTLKNRSENDSLLEEPVSSSTPNKLNPTTVEIYTVFEKNPTTASSPTTLVVELSSVVEDVLVRCTTLECDKSIGSENPNYLSARIPEKLKYKRKLSEAHRLIKDLERKVSHLSEMLAQTNSIGKCVQLCEKPDSNQGYNDENCIENSSILLNGVIQTENQVYNKDRSDIFKSNGTIVAPCYFDHNYAAPFNLKSKWFQRPVPDTQKHTNDHTYATWQREKIAVEFLTQPLESLPEHKSFICKTCSVSYNEKHLLTKHIKVMHCQNVTLQSPPVTCEKCGRKFRLKAQLDKHRCRQPPEEVAALAEAKKQKREFYNRFCELIDGERFYKCDLCSYYTTSKGNKLNCFKNHYKIHNTGFNVQCNLCVKTFRTTTAMKNHVDIVHHRLKKYSCSECGKKFALLGTLKTHLLIHKGEKPLVCHQCGKSFRHISKLRVHTRFVHLKEKNHRCQVCHKLYSTASQVKMHMTRHLGVRDHTCQVCFKAFFTKKYLSEHIKSVHNGNSSLLCVTCGKIYKSKRSLMFHRKTGHGTGTE